MLATWNKILRSRTYMGDTNSPKAKMFPAINKDQDQIEVVLHDFSNQNLYIKQTAPNL